MESDLKEEEFKELKEAERKSLKLIDDLKKSAYEYEELKVHNEENNIKLSKLFEMGVINDEGEYIKPIREGENEME